MPVASRSWNWRRTAQYRVAMVTPRASTPPASRTMLDRTHVMVPYTSDGDAGRMYLLVSLSMREKRANMLTWGILTWLKRRKPLSMVL